MAKPKSHKTLVAVYGSLKRGFHNYCRFLGDQRLVGLGTVRDFDMYSLGCFPMIIRGGGTVSVEVYEVDESAFIRLDSLEGFPHFYDRKRVNVSLNKGGNVKAWIYFGNAEQVADRPLIQSGVWTEAA